MRMRWRFMVIIGASVSLPVLSTILLIASSSSQAKQQEPKLKAIWEPVNFSEDLNLTDVHFATPDTGWAAGAAGTVIFTNDGGKTWKAQLGGDPKAADRPIVQLRFVDASHGFAAQ